MPSRKHALLLVVSSALLLAAPWEAFAQRGRPQMPKGEPINKNTPIKGTIGGMAGNRMFVDAGPNERYGVVFMPNTQVSVTGTAQIDGLRKGMWIRFNAKVDKPGPVKADVSKVTICDPSGVAAAPQGKPGPQGKPAPKEDKEPAESTAGTSIGQIVTAHGNHLTLKVEGVKGHVTLELPEAVTIDVHCSDLSLARMGDNVEISGGQKFGVMVQAGEATVTLAQPLSSGKKHPAAKASKEDAGGDKADKPEKPARKSKAKKPAKEEDAPPKEDKPANENK